MRTGSIYIIRNTINDKVYVGQTTMTVRERFLSHLRPSVHKQRSSYKLYNAMNKHGKENFYVETLEENVPLENINQVEIFYIEKYNSFHNGYNSTKGGDGRIFNKVTDELELLEMAKQGKSSIEIAEKHNVHNATILRALRKIGFHYYKNISKKELEKCLSKGMSNNEMAKKFNVHKYTITRHLTKHNLKRNRKAILKRTDINLISIIEEYKNGTNIKVLCEKYDFSESSFRRAIEHYSKCND